MVSSSQYGTLAIADNKAMKASGRKKQNFGRPKKGKADIHDYNTLMGLGAEDVYFCVSSKC